MPSNLHGITKRPNPRSMTSLMNDPFSGSFHLIHLLLNEYILHEIERLVSEKSMRELMINFVNGHQPPELPESNFIESLGPDFLSNPNLIRTQYVCCSPEELNETSKTLTPTTATFSEKGTHRCFVFQPANWCFSRHLLVHIIFFST